MAQNLLELLFKLPTASQFLACLTHLQRCVNPAVLIIDLHIEPCILSTPILMFWIYLNYTNPEEYTFLVNTPISISVNPFIINIFLFKKYFVFY